MKLGLGLYRDLLSKDNFQFARQAGVTHLVVHLTNYFEGGDPHLTSGSSDRGWGIAKGKPWSYEELMKIKKTIRSFGLEWEAIENFNPLHWYDILLDGPQKDKQLEDIKTIIRNVGKAGIPIIGYNFSIAGVWGWTIEPRARGEALTMVFDANKIKTDTPIPNGMVWNMIYDPEAPPGIVPRYYEAFVDEGDINMIRALKILKRNGYDGLLVPDHTPQMSTATPWHTGMAFALGYMRGALQAIESVNSEQ